MCKSIGEFLFQKMRIYENAKISISDIDLLNFNHTLTACKDVNFFNDGEFLAVIQNTNLRLACTK